jgi:hypothetical protein
MPEQSFRDLVVLFTAGLALILLAAVRIIGRRWPGPARLGASTAVVVGAALGPVALEVPSASVWPVIVVVVVAAAICGLGSARLAGGVQAALAGVRRPGVQAGLMAVAGVVIAAGAVVTMGMEEEASIDRGMEQMLAVTYKPPIVQAPTDSATTDGGRSVFLGEAQEGRSQEKISAAEREVLATLGLRERIIRLAPASDVCNCHGWVFTGGRYWLGPEDVERILVDNGYQQVSDPRPGDLAIYRQSGTINHTALVRAGGGGSTVFVEGKWGWMGVFLHQIGDSCYGNNCTFYRGPRANHMLAGLGAPANTVAAIGR